MIELRVHQAGAKPSTSEHEINDADNERDHTKADKGKAINDHRVSSRFDDQGVPIRPPSTHAENRTPMPVSLPFRPKVRPTNATYLRALRPSEPGMKPRFDEGDILRVIEEVRDLNGDLSVELIPLKPPGGTGRAPRRIFKLADQEDVDEVGRRADTEEEKETFRRAVEWVE